MSIRDPDVVLVDGALWIVVAETGSPAFDFDFRAVFPTTRPWQLPANITAVARIGAFDNYDALFAEFDSRGIRLINSPAEHYRASRLPEWYPLLREITPRSCWYDVPPTAAAIEDEFGWPVFIKGARQTSRHQKTLSIVYNRRDFDAAIAKFRSDPILNWQQLVVREFVPLRPVEDPLPDRIPSSFEFRTFWWRDECVGAGRYWWEGRRYEWTESERVAALDVARTAARKIKVEFAAIDVAVTTGNRWIVIECNDAQESGYAGASAIGMWQKIVHIERARQRDHTA